MTALQGERDEAEGAPPHPTLREATIVWAKIGLLGFGGPAGQIALMHKELVEHRRWISESRFLHALNFCMLLPGPEAQQLATYIGWLLHGTRGGVIAGTLFVIPGFLIILGLSAAYAVLQGTGWVGGLFLGLKAAVLAIVIEAVLRIGRRAIRTPMSAGLAAAAFIALFAFAVPFPVVVLAAGAIGYFGSSSFARPGHGSGAGVDRPSVIDQGRHGTEATVRGTLVTALVWGALWIVPLLLIAPAVGLSSVFGSLWAFFSQMAIVTFGGAYAVLAYVAQVAVEGFGWLNPGEMVDGLALAETTPGPLVLVLGFVGFLAAFRAPAGLDPLWAGVLGATLTCWVTFVPCFLWIFLGAPYIERLRSNRALSGALAAITAAVVGVILNLAIWFALHVLFREVGELAAGPIRVVAPVWQSLDLRALLLASTAAAALFWLRLGTVRTLAVCGGLGLLTIWLPV